MNVAEPSNEPNGGPDLADWLHRVNDSPRPFDTICQDLSALGALSVDDFLSSTSNSTGALDVSFYTQLPDPQPSIPLSVENENKEGKPVPPEAGEEGKDSSGTGSRIDLFKLHTACQQTFGSINALNFECIEENPKHKQCILTITRPGGATRVYRSDPFAKRGDAKAQVATRAIEMGALDFITVGDTDAIKARRGFLTNPLNVDADDMEVDETRVSLKFYIQDQGIKEIEQCCAEWRGNKVKPQYILYVDTKDKKKHGAALRISLNPHLFRVYVTDPIYNTAKLAKYESARIALESDVLDFIKYGNGQTQPPPKTDEDLEDDSATDLSAPNIRGISLQEFYESLPKPFPEDFGDKNASEINAPAWLNTTLQTARGGRFNITFVPIMETIKNLYGCILRLRRPEETQTYIVDPQFPRRSDAKPAVCFLAISQGVGDYIRKVKEELDNRISPERRKLANEKLYQILSAEAKKIRPGNLIEYSYEQDRDAFGCKLQTDISASGKPDIREYRVPPEYRVKADAKAAVACHAAESGLVDLLRFRGEPLPSDYTPFWEALLAGSNIYLPKRKQVEREADPDAKDRKKRKKGAFSASPEPGEIIEDTRTKGSDPSRRLNNTNTKTPPKGMRGYGRKPHVSVPSALNPTNAFASNSHLTAKEHSGNRNRGSYPVRSPPPQPRHPTVPPPMPSSCPPPPHTGHIPQPAMASPPSAHPYPSYPPPTTYSNYQPPHAYPADPHAYAPYPSQPPPPAGYGPVPGHSPYYSSSALPPAPYPQYGHYHYGGYPPPYPTYSSPYPQHQVLYPVTPQPLVYPLPHPASVPPTPPHYAQTLGSPYSHRSSLSPPPMSPFHHPHRQDIPVMDYSRNQPGIPTSPRHGKQRDRSQTPACQMDSFTSAVEETPSSRIQEASLREQRALEDASKSSLDLLHEFCQTHQIKPPTFYDQLFEDNDGRKRYKIWAIKDAQRLELHSLFENVEDGRERLSKKILNYEQKRLGQSSNV
ncbi:hypothetical protein CVT24_002101 [Panaeolus cyanescens]|uniref:Uncharacterized protein n=1 Tax=Panaeolus cyanescens TaxID=181874 RepID=A0A409YI28_9AGAR|nr:hypothetical protein CVT24_002101 [Panaeolus cyanescens]